MEKYVMNVSAGIKDAKAAVSQLIQEGYPKNSISILADKTVVAGLDDVDVAVEDASVYGYKGEKTWDRIKNFFGHKGNVDDTAYYGHQQDIRNGSILVLVDTGVAPKEKHAVAAQKDDKYWKEAHDKAVNEPDDETIRLMREHLKVGKETVATGEVILKKHIVEETETVEVPVMHEELVIERHPVNETAGKSDSFDEDTITIPLSEEQIHISKEPVVTEEIHVKKREISETKQVSDQVRKEELDVDKTGNVILESGARR